MRLTICVVDDDKVYQFAVRKTIEATGMADSVLTFSNGAEAISYLETHKSSSDLPDIIFLDINMPVMNGWQFLENYARISLGKNIPVYMVSSSIDEHDINKSRQYQSVADYILKPVHKEKFSQLLASIPHN
ncbi:response regulator [Danxiaibacter flavus]|uniref:Response regulator n=1 Tax=Danxiaibacter flavus TaxID=3049108 RepID=A0ABV3ZGW0_9BACT|nr:response regulator [Chitinophagaceae bacterium DXS]